MLLFLLFLLLFFGLGWGWGGVPEVFQEAAKKTSGNGGTESHFHAVDSCQICHLSNFTINQSQGCYHNPSNQERGSDSDLLVRHHQSTDHRCQRFSFPSKKQKKTSGIRGRSEARFVANKLF